MTDVKIARPEQCIADVDDDDAVVSEILIYALEQAGDGDFLSPPAGKKFAGLLRASGGGEACEPAA